MDANGREYPPRLLANGEVDDGELHQNIEHRCVARAKTNDGKQCRRSAVPGATVCIYHGGSAPQVRAAAMRRVLALVDPALEELSSLIGDMDKNISLRAVLATLEKAGVGAAARIDLRASIGSEPTDRPEVDAMIAAALDERWREYEERKKMRPALAPAPVDEARPA